VSIRSDGQICLMAAIAVAVLIVYGSLIPFDFRRPDTFNPVIGLAHIPFTPWSRISRTDLFVNVAVGLPLGFVLMGALRSARRQSPVATAIAVLVAGCVSMILGSAVEMVQVLSPMRNSSWNDVLGQGLGAIAGALAWTVTGPSVMVWLRRLAHERESTHFARHLLQLFLPIYLVLQLTSVDAARTAKVAAEYGEGRVTVMPSASPFESTFVVMRDFAGNALLNIPIGTLAALGWVRGRKRRAIGWAIFRGVAMIVAVEIAQEFVGLGDARVGDLLAGAVGVILGIAIARQLMRHRLRNPIDGSRVVNAWFLAAAGAWTLLLVGQNWHPFDFQLTSEIVTQRLTRISLIPFAFSYWYASYVVSPLQAIHETLLKFVLAVPLGLLLRLAWPLVGGRHARLRRAAVTVAAAIVLIGIELGQIFLPMRFPDVTDVLIGTIGALVGDVTARALAARRQPTSDRIRTHPPALDAPSAQLSRTTSLLDKPSMTQPWP
jgi:glycopeptide antibiotics resistance protein